MATLGMDVRAILLTCPIHVLVSLSGWAVCLLPNSDKAIDHLHSVRQHQNQTTARSTKYTQHAIWIHYTTGTNSHLQYVSNKQTRQDIPKTRVPRKQPAWSYGENDSSPWTPECILTSVLTNTSQLAQRVPGQPGRHSTGCVHGLTGQE